MVLPARQRRILEKIEHALRGTDPRLTSLFAIFSRLNIDEEMPRIEQLRASASLTFKRLRRDLALAGRRLHARSPARRRAAFFFPLALVVVASTLAVAAALPGPTRCAAAAAAVGAARHGTKAKGCKSGVMNPVPIGK
jgi:hypothetical protein